MLRYPPKGGIKKMKKILAILMALTLALPMLAAAEQRDIADILREDKTTQAFTDDPVSEDDLTKIVEAGVNAPSAMNSQPWHFTVVTNADVLAQMNGESFASDSVKAGVADAAAAIVISSQTGDFAQFDCGEACGWMNAAARALGYGTKVVAAPRNNINGNAELEAALGIPEDMDVVAILLVGVTDTSIDGATGSTERIAFDEAVTYVK